MTRPTDLLDNLESLGLYRYTDPEQIPTLRRRFVLGSGYLLEEQTKRVYPFDLEYLAEGGVKAYLESLMPFMRMQGVRIQSIAETFDTEGQHYTISIDGRDYIIYSANESAFAETWSLTAVRTSILVNDMLSDAGSGERFYVVRADGASHLLNDRLCDTGGVFLTFALFRTMSASIVAKDGNQQALISFLDRTTLASLLGKV